MLVPIIPVTCGVPVEGHVTAGFWLDRSCDCVQQEFRPQAQSEDIRSSELKGRFNSIQTEFCIYRIATVLGRALTRRILDVGHCCPCIVQTPLSLGQKLTHTCLSARKLNQPVRPFVSGCPYLSILECFSFLKLFVPFATMVRHKAFYG